MKVLQFPLAKITIVFLTGIITAFYFNPNPNIVFLLLAILFSLLSILFFLSKKIQQTKIYFSILSYSISFLIGISSLIIQTDTFQKENYTNYKSAFDKEVPITVVIREKLRNTNYYQRYIAIIQTIDGKKYNGKIILNLPEKSTQNLFEVGTILHLNGHLQKNKATDNPMQFDYGSYLNRKQIYAQLYTNPVEIKNGEEYKKDLWYFIAKIRSKIIRNLEKTNFNPTALHVATALILGQRQEVAPEIIQDYQYAGAVHILSVSGLHVGFLFLFLNFLLKPIPNTRKGSLIKLVVVLSCLFLFAILAGLSASIVRSAAMFSFVAIGLYLRRNVNIYHTLLVSILLILLFQPYFLFDVGFQLSYLAVFFIVWFQPVLVSYWNPKNKILKYGWGILSVSIAAQLGTLPLSLYYFHQFPGLFFVTNLLVIPLLSLIMFQGIIIMILAAFGITYFWLVQPLEWSIILLNKIINSIASLEQFIIKDIPFNFSLLIVSYLLIISFINWIKKPQFNKLLLVLLSIIALQSTILITNWNLENEQEWIVFNLKQKTLIAHRQGKEVSLLSNDTTVATNKILNSYLIGNFSHIKQQQKLQHLDYFKGNKILIMDSLGICSEKIKAEIILITQSPKINLDRMLNILKPRVVIADGSNYKYILKQWKVSCQKQKIPFHATAEKGYFQIK